jgi:hypothetical protein
MNPDGCSYHWCGACGMRVSQTHECPAAEESVVCGAPESDCDHGEGYHHALSDLRAALDSEGGTP